MSTHSSDRDVGNAWTAHILGSLFDSWPRRQDFNVFDLSVTTSVEPKRDPEELFDDLMLWLRENGYVRFEQDGDGNAYGVSLTERGFAVLGTRPEGLDRPLGSKMKEAAASASDYGRAEAIETLVGTLLGTEINSPISGWKTGR